MHGRPIDPAPNRRHPGRRPLRRPPPPPRPASAGVTPWPVPTPAAAAPASTGPRLDRPPPTSRHGRRLLWRSPPPPASRPGQRPLQRPSPPPASCPGQRPLRRPPPPPRLTPASAFVQLWWLLRAAVTPEDEQLAVNTGDLMHLWRRVEEKDGGLSWIHMMDCTLPTMRYQAWRRGPPNGPPHYHSSTIFEDTSPEVVRDFFWDDEFRIKNSWDNMLLQHETLEECTRTGTLVVLWVRKWRKQA